MPGPSSADGAPSWTLHDPAAHRFIRIGWLEFEILSRWQLGTIEAMIEAIGRETILRPDPADVIDMMRFAERADLLQPLGEGGVKRLMAQTKGRKLGLASWLLKNYLFLRLRLLDPDRLLAALVPRLGFLFGAGFPKMLLGGALLGLFLVGRQWDGFIHSLPDLLSLDGALMVGLALTCSKIVHEMGHGLAAKRFGCRVPAMGVALLVLWPVLWTDTTDAWRLTDRRQRLLIDAAGMLAEITLAVVAALAWTVLPDGALRSAAFTLTSSTWLLTLAVNLNPFMRFDGYFLLSDWLDMPNLQERAFAMTRWRLREALFHLGEPPPEPMPKARRRLVTVYALATWIYRFTVFLGIALLVYHLAFKLLGLFLMGVELWWFITRPIIGEVAAWRAHLGKKGVTTRARLTLSAGAAAVVVLLLPMGSHVAAPAMQRAERQAVLYTAEPGRLTVVATEGTHLDEGQAAFGLDSPDLLHRQRQDEAKVGGLEARLQGVGFESGSDDNVVSVGSALSAAVAERDQARTQIDSLLVRAPFAGVVVDVSPSLRVGSWLPRHHSLGILVDPRSQVVEAFVNEADVERLAIGGEGTFYPENGEPPFPVRLSSVNRGASRELAVPELASVNGGGLAVRKDPEGHLVPEFSVYRVLLTPEGTPGAIHRTQRGTVIIDAASSIPLAHLWRRLVAVAIRESGL